MAPHGTLPTCPSHCVCPPTQSVFPLPTENYFFWEAWSSISLGLGRINLFFFPLCLPNSVLYYNQVFTKRRCHILRKALNQELDDLDSGAATGWLCIFNKALVLTCKMQITLASPALQTGLNEMCGSAWKFSSLVPGLVVFVSVWVLFGLVFAPPARLWGQRLV